MIMEKEKSSIFQTLRVENSILPSPLIQMKDFFEINKQIKKERSLRWRGRSESDATVFGSRMTIEWLNTTPFHETETHLDWISRLRVQGWTKEIFSGGGGGRLFCQLTNIFKINQQKKVNTWKLVNCRSDFTKFCNSGRRLKGRDSSPLLGITLWGWVKLINFWWLVQLARTA